MTQRASFEDIYGIRFYKSGTLSDGGVGADTAGVFNTATADADAFAAGAIGIDTSKYAIPLLNHPHIEHGVEIINQRKAVGTSYRRSGSCMEYIQGARIPTVTLECDATKKILGLFCYLLFQGGSSEEAGTPYLKTFSPYGEGTESVVASAAIVRLMSAGTANSHLMGGAIIKSMTLSAEEGQPLKVTADFTGYNSVSDYDFDAAANILEFDNTACLMWSNASVKLSGTAVNIPGFSVTITNNAVPKYYNSTHVTKYVLGDFTATGSFKVPYAATTVGDNTQINNFVAGTDCLFQVWWGNETPSADGDVKVELNAYYTGASLSAEDEITSDLTFEATHDGTNAAIKIQVADLVDRGI